MRIRTFAVLILASLSSIALIACPASLDERCADEACSKTAQDGNNPLTDGGEGGADQDAPPTDPCVNTPNDPKCITEDSAFFVSTKGDDVGGLGTRDKPFQTVTATLGKLTDKKRRLYICEGTYPEDVVLTASHNSVSLFGGVACDWTPSPQVQPLFGKSALALKIDGASGVAIADLAFKSIDAVGAGNSSIAAFVNGGETTLKHVALTAGKGVTGDPGVLVPFNLAPFTQASLAGNVGDSPTNGSTKSVTCPSGVTIGGAGGANNGADGASGTTNPEPIPAWPSNKGTLTACSGSGTAGGNGMPGASPLAKPGVTVFGDLTAAGWLPTRGSAGDNGGIGQGGGGGGGFGGGYGGSGGAGGCGGAGGVGGQGGGGSIGLASFAATIHITSSILIASAAGDGAAGSGGQVGVAEGGFGGNGTMATGGCKGGKGGGGGSGAPAGGGAGGVSVGVLYKGSKPDLDTMTTSAIVTGAKTSGGLGPGNKGTDGDNSPVLEIK